MRLRRAGLLGAAITFAQTQQGQRVLRQVRAKVDTPANRAKAQELLANLRGPKRT